MVEVSKRTYNLIIFVMLFIAFSLFAVAINENEVRAVGINYEESNTVQVIAEEKDALGEVVSSSSIIIPVE